MAIMTNRPTREDLYSKVWYDNRDSLVPKKAVRYCKKHGIETLNQLMDALVSEDSNAQPTHT